MGKWKLKLERGSDDEERTFTKKVTVVTLYRDCACEHYVGVIEGSLTGKQKVELAKRFKLGCDDHPDEIFFCECDLKADPKILKILYNIDSDGTISGPDENKDV